MNRSSYIYLFLFIIHHKYPNILSYILTWMGGGEGVVKGGQARRVGAAWMEGWGALVAKHSSARGCRTELKSKSESISK